MHLDWLASHVPAGRTVAVDGQVLGLAAAQALKTTLDRAGVTLRTDLDPVDAIWPERPGLPPQPVYEHLAPHAPLPRVAKLAQVREAMVKHGATNHFVSTVDDIAWITNLRGADVNYNPVFLAHLLIDAQQATLFVAEGKVDTALATRLAADGVRLVPYAQAGAALAALPDGQVLLIDPKRVTFGLREHVPATVRVVEAINPSTLLKSRKTADEAVHIREAMRQDGAAMCEFYAWFEAALARLRGPELSGHRRLQRQRRHAALPRHAAVFRGDRGRRPAAHRLGRPVPGRHHRHHPRLAHR